MSILKVARMGHPVLARPGEPVEPSALASARVQALIDDMIETMRDERGVGLAGPQVHELLRVFVMDPGEDDGGLRVVVNPVLRFPEAAMMRLWEGCLSMPGIRGLTERHHRVEVQCLDREGRPQELTFEGFPAAIVQHETDHLDGKLFPERMPDLSKMAFDDEYARFHAADDEEEDDDA